MHIVAEKLEKAAVTQELGEVIGKEGPRFRVRTLETEWPAAKAVSCLVQPELGDLVLVSVLPDGSAYLLAVLERDEGRAPEGGATRLVVDGDLELHVATGQFTVAAREGVQLASAGDVSVTSSGFRVNATEGSFAFRQFRLLSGVASVELEELKSFVSRCESVLDRVVQRVKRSYRFVEESDNVRAQKIDYSAKGAMSLHAKNAILTAEQLVKLDGEQLHLG